MRYRRHDNCFTWVEHFKRAQALMDERLSVNWAERFDGIVPHIHPTSSEFTATYPPQYRRTYSESEWPIDLVFRQADFLRRLYPQLVHLAIISFTSPDVLRFMGKKVSRQGTAVGIHELPISTDLKVRTQAVRIKHRLGPNSFKLHDKAYDEQDAVLRPEVTISVPGYFQVFRPGSAALRASTADMHLRAHVSQKALDRHCSALAVADDSSTLEEFTASIECRVGWHGQPIRRCTPLADGLAVCFANSRTRIDIKSQRRSTLARRLSIRTPCHRPSTYRACRMRKPLQAGEKSTRCNTQSSRSAR